MRRLVGIAVMSGLLLTACAKPQIDYYWGDYSESLYRVKKIPGPTVLQDHKRALLHIIDESKQRGLRVPPGVYGEYGYLLLQDGNAADGLRYLELEAVTYPESRVFVERVKTQAQRVTGERPQ